jgi:hypothetical protein
VIGHEESWIGDGPSPLGYVAGALLTCSLRSRLVTIPDMRDRETIDAELRLLVAVRRVCREQDGRVPSVRLIDALLDERSELTGS